MARGWSVWVVWLGLALVCVCEGTCRPAFIPKRRPRNAKDLYLWKKCEGNISGLKKAKKALSLET